MEKKTRNVEPKMTQSEIQELRAKTEKKNASYSLLKQCNGSLLSQIHNSRLRGV